LNEEPRSPFRARLSTGGATYPLIKICGLTRPDEALAAVAAGADWIGLNFHPGSPRRVDPATAGLISAALPATASAVGLFVNRPPAEVAETAARIGLRIVQLHGDEPPEDLLALGDLWIIRAFRLADESAVARMMDYLQRAEHLGRAPDAVLIDGYSSTHHGGTGQTIGLDLLDRLPPLPRLILAGGLTPENVADGIEAVKPWAVDVASGVEASPGIKDPAKLEAFFAAVDAAHVQT
jgi:phosphoribosylanthranilate isomerase